jgi:putative transposase
LRRQTVGSGSCSRLWTGWRAALVIVKPETVIAWHRRGFRLWWTWKSRGRIGRPTMPADIRTLIRTMAQANPRWGAPRIHGELLKVGIDVCQATVAKYLGRRRQPPSQTWRTFLTNHIGQIVAADFFVVPTATYRLLFVLVLLAHDRRRIRHVAVTAHPTAAWTAQQLREAFPWDEAPRYLMTLYCSYYENARTHLALDKDTPIPRPVMPPGDGDIVAIPEVGGLHHRYERHAA